MKRCPRCGAGGLFTALFTMRERCPRCDLVFGDDEGYWLGAVMINLAVTEAAFVIVLVAMVAGTWPDVPWGWVLVVALLVNALMPILFFQRSRMPWVAVTRTIRS